MKAVEAPGEVKIDDDFAKTLGLESLAKLRDAVKDRIAREHAGASRQKLKRALLDQLDERHKFEPPPSLVEQEFNSVWAQIEKDLKDQGKTFADEGTTEEKAREEYRGIAERRVRLGLVIAEIGERNNIKVSDEQLRAALNGASAAISRSGAADLGILPEESRRTCCLARAPVRGQGGRLPDRTG